MEAIEYGAEEATPNADFEAFATAYAPDAQRDAEDILAQAKEEFPDFEAQIRALCR